MHVSTFANICEFTNLDHSHRLSFPLLFRSFKEAGICLKNFAQRCLDDRARTVTGLILSGVRIVGGAFCGSQQEKEGIVHNIIIQIRFDCSKRCQPSNALIM